MTNNHSSQVELLLQSGQNPILPFERRVLRHELSGLGVQQDELSRLLGEAMDQSSETWHDNAPADAINLQSRIVAGRAEKLISSLSTSMLIGYPDVEDTQATIGSVVEVCYPGDLEPISLILTGLCRSAPQSRMNPGIEAITARSPLGRALIGVRAGTIALYEVNARKLNVTVLSVVQTNECDFIDS